MPDPDTTQAHAAWAKNGDSRGFTTLYERIAPALYAWASLRIAAAYRGHLDPDDVVQEVWWRALDAFESYDPAKGAFRAWIFQIANRVLLNGLRALRVRGQIADGTGRPLQLSLPDHLAAQATSISEKASRAECTRNLMREVDALESEERALFGYCALEGMTATKAAGLLGLSADAAHKRWQRLREKLRASLGAAFLDEQH